jgi:hypothetical protein
MPLTLTDRPMPDIFLFTVVDAFALSGKLTLVPGLPQNPDLPMIRPGAQIRLVTHDGTTFESHIAGFEKISYGRKLPRDKISMPISLPASMAKEQVPAGTEVFLVLSKSK